jgi:hypothetical protein
VPRDESKRKEYEFSPRITDMMPINASGIVTARDDFVFDFEDGPILRRVSDLRDKSLSDDQIRARYFQGKGSPRYAAGDSRGWKLPDARTRIRDDRDWASRIVKCLYRPFDVRRL